ncbi:MAG: hypothetical protein MUF45_18565 [Spirosomaceae bacterium]|jgi:hypothetical protein|nr:hypothetical protein [Spirosomataceae bacterium]
MRLTLAFLGILVSNIIFAQTVESTNSIKITGLVENPVEITFQEIEKSKIVDLGNFKITNHAGEFRKEYKNVKGIALIDFLKEIKITASSPKVLSEYFIVFRASDGYSVVASWNEVFNTEIGNSFYIVVEADGKSLRNGSERILMIATKDFKTGRRHIKGLQTIEIRKI